VRIREEIEKVTAHSAFSAFTVYPVGGPSFKVISAPVRASFAVAALLGSGNKYRVDFEAFSQ
jgi:hypothetical protein